MHAPANFFEKEVKHIEGIGQASVACFLTKTGFDPSKWYVLILSRPVLILCVNRRWLFEKYDGVRGLWNPHNRTMYSRTGRELALPSEIVESMPDIFLDGELWYARLSFSVVSYPSLGLAETTSRKL